MPDTGHNLLICADPEELGSTAAAMIVDLAHRAVQERSRFTICLSGGTTPRGTYELLASDPLHRLMPWEKVHIFWGDERCIPYDRPDNHLRMASDLMLSRVPIPSSNIHPMRGEAPDPQQAAKEYEESLRVFFGLSEGDFPRFDAILLGMGADGHTASLFPGTPGTTETRSLVVGHYVPKLNSNRLTLTFPALNQARHVIFLVAGEAKAEALKAVLEGKSDTVDLPAQRVRPHKGEVHWLVDRAAASLLRTR